LKFVPPGPAYNTPLIFN